MVSDRLYELAFAFRKAHYLQYWPDSAVFAVKLMDGRIGYISMMNGSEEYCAFNFYIGDDGFESLRTIVRDDSRFLGPFKRRERLFERRCLQCSFQSREKLSKKEKEDALHYAKAHGIKIAGKNAYPQFAKYLPDSDPWYQLSEEEQSDLCEALAAIAAMNHIVKGKFPDEIGLKRLDDTVKEMLMLEQVDGTYVLKKTKVPHIEKKLPVPVAWNKASMEKLRKIEKSGVWECEIARFYHSIQKSSEEIPYYPSILLAVEEGTGDVLPISPVAHYEEMPEKLLDVFMEAFLMIKACPKEIHVRDERTYALLEKFCEKMGIAASMESCLFELNGVEYELMESFILGDFD